MCQPCFGERGCYNALKTLLSHPEKAQRMGRNGRDAVVEKYNWDEEEPKLLELYSEICE